MITSKSNELIKHIKALHQKKYRDEYGEFFVEGMKMVQEAISEGMQICKIVVCEEILKESFSFEDAGEYDVEYVNENVFNFISDTKTPQGIMAIIKMPLVTEPILESDIGNGNGFEEKERLGDTIFALDNLQDPGNLGTIIRTLDCAGINTLLLSEGTVDLYNPKVIRSTMGAIFRVRCFVDLDLKDKLSELKNSGYKVVVTALDAEISHYDLDFKEKYVIVIGNEAKGVSKEVQDMADIKVKIPMLGRTESLNASVAASLMAYERVRKASDLK